jgi:hypothetical protein
MAPLAAVGLVLAFGAVPANATSDSDYLTIPGSKGKITSNAWRTTGNGTASGNTLKWDYQVSAVYSGSKTVEKIRTTWTAGASLRNSANISVGVSGSGVNAGAGSGWQWKGTKAKYWENSNGTKVADWRSNISVAPKKDYRKDTIALTNTAKVKLKSDAKSYEITASA